MTPPGDVQSPTLAGLSQAAAIEALTKQGLAVGVVTHSSSETIPAGQVVGTRPTAGADVAPGSAIDLEVSSGPEQVVVPDVTGSTQAAADATLKAARLTPGVVATSSSTTVGKGNVISASPAPGTRVPPGTSVDLEVSNGPAHIAVPSLVGLNRIAADALLRSSGLSAGSVTTETSAAVPAGGTSSQHPLPGTLVSPGGTVDFALSSGTKSGLLSRLPGISLGLLGLLLLVFLVWGLRSREGQFLTTLAREDIARGLITFLIVFTTVGIAVILALSTILLEDSPENDKRFDRGKQVLTILIGVLGTIVGFYFGSARDVDTAATQFAISTESLAPAAANRPYEMRLQVQGGTTPLFWTVSRGTLPAGIVLDPNGGAISGTPTASSSTELTFTVTDGSSPPAAVSKTLKLEVK